MCHNSSNRIFYSCEKKQKHLIYPHKDIKKIIRSSKKEKNKREKKKVSCRAGNTAFAFLCSKRKKIKTMYLFFYIYAKTNQNIRWGEDEGTRDDVDLR